VLLSPYRPQTGRGIPGALREKGSAQVARLPSPYLGFKAKNAKYPYAVMVPNGSGGGVPDVWAKLYVQRVTQKNPDGVLFVSYRNAEGFWGMVAIDPHIGAVVETVLPDTHSTESAMNAAWEARRKQAKNAKAAKDAA